MPVYNQRSHRGRVAPAFSCGFQPGHDPPLASFSLPQQPPGAPGGQKEWKGTESHPGKAETIPGCQGP